MSLRLDWADVQQTRPVVLARRMDAARIAGGLVLPGKTWRTPAGEGANYMFEGPSVQVRARILPRGFRGQVFQVFSDPKGGRGLARVRLSAAAREPVDTLEQDLYRRICEKDARVRDCTWNGVQVSGVLELDLLCDGNDPYVSLPEDGLATAPEQGLLCDVVLGLHRVVVNHSRNTVRPVWVLLGVRKHVSRASSSDDDVVAVVGAGEV